uniref:Isoaspartyl peptidase/L-asparaginase n=1 Tax=Paramormyrops kingsleyae TaxID=1676925 RepID=A0A3B3RF37_9TELE
MPSLPVLVVHGGAGHIPKDRAQISCAGVREAARVGYACLQAGGSAMDAVTEAVTNLENNPAYNAGRGSVLTQHGTVEMDAIVMDGRTLASGAVSAVRRIANPVQLARLVMEKTSHLCLTAEGASHFARAMGVPEVPEESLITEYARMRWRKNLDPDANPVQCMMMGGETPSAPVDTHDTEGKIGTVGAVAVDAQGNIACATSTGGMLNKMEGRVGDTACIGCGAYADNHVGAVSPTGHGEAIMKVTLSRLILFYMEQGTPFLTRTLSRAVYIPPPPPRALRCSVVFLHSPPPPPRIHTSHAHVSSACSGTASITPVKQKRNLGWILDTGAVSRSGGGGYTSCLGITGTGGILLKGKLDRYLEISLCSVGGGGVSYRRFCSHSEAPDWNIFTEPVKLLFSSSE